MTRRHQAVQSFIALLLIGSAACSSSSASGAPDDAPVDPDDAVEASEAQDTPEFTVGRVHYLKRCAETFADRCWNRCDDCWSECFGLFLDGVDCTGVCHSICECSDTYPPNCASWTGTFDFGEADANNESACQLLSTNLTKTCGTEIREPLCHTMALAERPEAAAMYSCAAEKVAQGDCDSFDSGCSFPPEELGTTLCAEAFAECGTCPLDVALVDAEAGWLRDDVRAAASACLDLADCYERMLCLEAWQDAAFPAASS